jgi:sugar/nucleoside kinase (ribokinase family)
MVSRNLRSSFADENSSAAANKRRVRIRAGEEEKAVEWAIPYETRIICAGLACVDMQLNQATGGDGGESIETFEGEKSIGGGSVSMACKTLARLCHGEALDEGYMQVSPPVVSTVTPLCMVGNDDTGTKLLSLLERCGSASRNVDTRVIRNYRTKDPSSRTALAVLPIYQDGRRGCFFDAASNDQFTTERLLEMVQELSPPNLKSKGVIVDTTGMSVPIYGGLLFGYPHLLPHMRGHALARFFQQTRKILSGGGVIALDLNGVSRPESPIVMAGAFRSLNDLRNDRVIGPALEHVDILHLNEDELVLLTGCRVLNLVNSQEEDEFVVAKAVELFLQCGVAVVAVTRGSKGSYVACNNAERFERSPSLPASWSNCSVHMPAAILPKGTRLNTNGAGDAYTSGLLVASMLRHTGKIFPDPTLPYDEGSSPRKEQETFKASSQGRSNSSGSGGKKMTPYTLYMKENYVMLKQQCRDDKKAIFTRCHEMWESESDEVKGMYERMVREEYDETGSDVALSDTSLEGLRDMAAAYSSASRSNSSDNVRNPIERTENACLNIESAIQFAGLVAAYHIDTSTRDLSSLDLGNLLEASIVSLSPTSTNEI